MQHTQLYDRTRRNIGRRKAETQTRVYGGRNWNHITTPEGERLSPTKFLPEFIQMWRLLMTKLNPILCWNNRKIMYRVPHVFILMDPGKAFPTKSRLGEHDLQLFWVQLHALWDVKNRSQTESLPCAHNKEKLPRINFFYFFSVATERLCEIEMRGLRVVWYEWLLAPDPDQLITFKSFWAIYRTYQLAIFYFVDTS